MGEILESLQSDSGWLVALILVLLILTGTILIKNGMLRVHTSKFSMSMSNEKERAIIRHQTEWAHLACMAFEEKIPKDYEGYNLYRSKYILELIYDEIIDWIMFNHIKVDKDYIKLKQNIVWKLVLNNTSNDNIRTKKFEKEVQESVVDLIENLVLIRQQYEEEKD